MELYDPPSLSLEHAIAKTIRVDRVGFERNNGRLERFVNIEPCYRLDIDDLPDGSTTKTYTMGYGFLERLEKLMEKNGVKVILEDAYPPDTQSFLRLLPDMDYVKQADWRDNQLKIIDDITRHSHGQYVAATGAGKSHLIRQLCKVYPRARICVTTYSATVLQQLYEGVTEDGDIDAGIYSSHVKKPVGRVLFCSIGCLHHFDSRIWDILVLDEKHECATLDRMAKLLRMRCRKAFAFSADHNNRADEADPWLVAMFGEARVNIGHLEVVANKDIVPVEVNWETIDVRGFENVDSRDPRLKQKIYWQNEYRNQRIAELALLHKNESMGQTLVYVETIEHAYRLRQMLDCPVAHRSPTPDRWDELKQQGLVGARERSPNHTVMEKLRRDYAAGKHSLAICNSVWKRGVNFHQLCHLIRGDGSASEQDATQITGRVTRKFTNKVKGYVIDMKDIFNDAGLQKSQMRKRHYTAIGYPQIGWK